MTYYLELMTTNFLNILGGDKMQLKHEGNCLRSFKNGEIVGLERAKELTRGRNMKGFLIRLDLELEKLRGEWNDKSN